MQILSSINYLAVAVSTVIYFITGYFWYSNMGFGKVWMKEKGFSMENRQRPGALSIAFSYGGLLISEFLLVLGLAILIQAFGITGISGGIKTALVVSVLFIFPLHSGTLFFPPQPKLFLLDWGYYSVGALIAGIILGLWK